MSAFETVHTVTNYYDGPRGGIADYQGQPYVYRATFEDDFELADVFLLQPVDDETLQPAIEDWSIWCRTFAAGRPLTLLGN